MPLSDLAADIKLTGASFSLARGLLKCSCGLSLSVAAFKREEAVAFWRQHAAQVKAAHTLHHNQHFGVAASLMLITSDNPAALPVCFCSDNPFAPRALL